MVVRILIELHLIFTLPEPASYFVNVHLFPLQNTKLTTLSFYVAGLKLEVHVYLKIFLKFYPIFAFNKMHSIFELSVQ